GRTGKLFAYEYAGIEPDILASAKGIGSGFPMGACLSTKKAAVGMTAGTHGSTYATNPLAMRVGNAVMDILLAPDFLPKINNIAHYLASRLEALRQAYPEIITEVRGKGLMQGIKLTKEP